MVVLLLVTALMLGARSGADQPRLSVPDQHPFTVDGAGFRSGESIKVVVGARNRVSRTVTAGPAGRFHARMRAVRLGSCPMFAIRATGSQGSRASLKIVPACADLVPPGN